MRLKYQPSPVAHASELSSGKIGAEIARFAAALVDAEERRAAAALAAIEAEEHQHRVAAGVIVDVVPVGVADRVDAIGALAVAAVGQAERGGVVRCGKRELAARRQDGLRLTGRHGRTKAGAGGRIDETAGGGLRGGEGCGEQNCGAQRVEAHAERKPTPLMKHCHSPSVADTEVSTASANCPMRGVEEAPYCRAMSELLPHIDRRPTRWRRGKRVN